MTHKKSQSSLNSQPNKSYFVDILVTVAIVMNDDHNTTVKLFQAVYDILSQECKYFEILVIDNAASDRSRQALFQLQKRLPNIRVLILASQCSQEISLLAALENSIGDYVVLFNPISDPPDLIPKLIKTAQSGYDIVIARQKSRQGKTGFERWMARISTWVLYRLFRTSFPLKPSFYQVLSRSVVTAITKSHSKNSFQSYYGELPGFTQKYITYSPTYRQESRSQNTAGLFFTTGLNNLLSNSTTLLRLGTYLGILATFANIGFLIYMFTLVFVYKHSGQEWINATFMSTSMFLLIFIILTTITACLARMLSQPKAAPSYFVTEEVTSLVIAEADRVNVV